MNTALAQLVERELELVEIQSVQVTEDGLAVDLRDGRTIITPLLWYPRLAYATPAERQHYEIRRNAIHWPDLDEDISVRGMLLGRKSGESAASLQKWLEQRKGVPVVR